MIPGANAASDADTPETCQVKCQAETKCNWFTWSDAGRPKGCWLLSKKGSSKKYDHGRNLGATGPKYCTGK